MKKTLLLLSTLIAAATLRADPAPELDYWWDIETTMDASYPIPPIKRGESIILRPRLLVRRAPADMTNVTQVVMRYWTDDMVAGQTYYSLTGSVYTAAQGRVEFAWTPASDAGADTYYYQLRAGNSEGSIYRGRGMFAMLGVYGTSQTNYVRSVQTWDWQDWEHVNTAYAPFLDNDDKLEIESRLAGHDAAISNVTDLVGDGVAGVSSNLEAHVADAAQTNAAQDAALVVAAAGLTSNLQAQAAWQVITNAAQDAAIAAAAAGATMGNDVTGQSSNAVVVATRGRQFPTQADVPADMEAIVWDSSLNGGVGGYKHGSVDLSGINENLADLQSNAVTKAYVDTEISEVRGLVDGNDHTFQMMESFETDNWLEIAERVWQHNRGWMAYGADVVGGNLVLDADDGYMVMSATQCVSRIVTTPSTANWSAMYATNATATTWYGYDPVRDNIVFTNMFGVKLRNTSGSALTVNRIDLYTWTFPERVAFTRDFAGLHLLVDTPAGDQLREAVNVQYIKNTVITGDVSGTLSSAFSVDKIKGGVVNATSRANGCGLIWYSSVSEHRYVDMATQFELDAAVNLLCTVSAYNALNSRVTAAEAGGIAISGDVIGSHLQTTTVARIRGKVIDTPTVNQTTPVYDLAQNKIVWLSVVGSNIVYAAGTNDIASVPASSAAFYRAMSGTNSIMPIVLDQQIVGWFGRDGLTLPYGTLNIMQSNLTANVRLYDGTASIPALATVSDPDTGWYRSAADVWQFVAAGNIIADFGVGGITLGTGQTITGLTGYASTGSVAAINSRLASVELWPTGTWTTAYSWGNHASAGYIGAPAATSAAEAVVGVYTGQIATAWQNPSAATNWTWTSDGIGITLTGYTGPNDVVIPDMLDGLPVTGFVSTFSPNAAGTLITTVSGGANITQVPYLAFSACAQLSSVDLPSVRVLASTAFAACVQLVTVNLPELVFVGDSAFDSCSALTHIELPKVTAIADYAFWGAYSLTSVVFSVNAPTVGADIYRDTPANQITNYVTSPTATGWGATFGGMPVVRMPATTDQLSIHGMSISLSGTNLIAVIGGVTNRIVLETYSE